MEKIIEGKLGKFYSTVCLLEQGFIKDPDQTIIDLLVAKGKELDDELSVRRFTRFGVGEAQTFIIVLEESSICEYWPRTTDPVNAVIKCFFIAKYSYFYSQKIDW